MSIYHKISSRFTLILLSSIITFGCEQTQQRFVKNNERGTQQWVYTTLHIPSKFDTAVYYYYGQVKSDLIDELENDNTDGYFHLKNIRFYNDSDKLEMYEDNLDLGYIIFKKNHIVKMNVLKADPIFTVDKKQLAGNSLKAMEKKR